MTMMMMMLIMVINSPGGISKSSHHHHYYYINIINSKYYYHYFDCKIFLLKKHNIQMLKIHGISYQHFCLGRMTATSMIYPP